MLTAPTVSMPSMAATSSASEATFCPASLTDEAAPETESAHWARMPSSWERVASTWSSMGERAAAPPASCPAPADTSSRTAERAGMVVPETCCCRPERLEAPPWMASFTPSARPPTVSFASLMSEETYFRASTLPARSAWVALTWAMASSRAARASALPGVPSGRVLTLL